MNRIRSVQAPWKERMSRRILNPATGKWVKRDGRVGRILMEMDQVWTDSRRCERCRTMWDWWSDFSSSSTIKRCDVGYWNTCLNDPIRGHYPLYLMRYEPALVNIIGHYRKYVRSPECPPRVRDKFRRSLQRHPDL